MRPTKSEHPSFYAGYINAVPEGDIVPILQSSGDDIARTLDTIPEERGGFAYADGKWTIRTVIGHLIDAERIFSYRALRLARGDKTPLPGFEENDYAVSARSDTRSINDLSAEFKILRVSTITLYASFPEDVWSNAGTVNNGQITVNALAYITTGHSLHHLAILRTRYGV